MVLGFFATLCLFSHSVPAHGYTAPAQGYTAPAQGITAPAQPPATGVVVYTALFQAVQKASYFKLLWVKFKPGFNLA